MQRHLIEVNTKEKAEHIILKGRGYKMHWQEYYDSFNDRYTYLIWYEPKAI